MCSAHAIFGVGGGFLWTAASTTIIEINNWSRCRRRRWWWPREDHFGQFQIDIPPRNHAHGRQIRIYARCTWLRSIFFVCESTTTEEFGTQVQKLRWSEIITPAIRRRTKGSFLRFEVMILVAGRGRKKRNIIRVFLEICAYTSRLTVFLLAWRWFELIPPIKRSFVWRSILGLGRIKWYKHGAELLSDWYIVREVVRPWQRWFNP